MGVPHARASRITLPKVSVLDGGMKKWLKEGRPTENKVNQDLGVLFHSLS